MKYYNLEIKEVLQELETDEKGLTSKQVSERINKDGKNIIIEAKSTPLLIKFLNEFKDLMKIVYLFHR